MLFCSHHSMRSGFDVRYVNELGLLFSFDWWRNWIVRFYERKLITEVWILKTHAHRNDMPWCFLNHWIIYHKWKTRHINHFNPGEYIKKRKIKPSEMKEEKTWKWGTDWNSTRSFGINQQLSYLNGEVNQTSTELRLLNPVLKLIIFNADECQG